jgi:hypothetical protein
MSRLGELGVHCRYDSVDMSNAAAASEWVNSIERRKPEEDHVHRQLGGTRC